MSCSILTSSPLRASPPTPADVDTTGAPSSFTLTLTLSQPCDMSTLLPLQLCYALLFLPIQHLDRHCGRLQHAKSSPSHFPSGSLSLSFFFFFIHLSYAVPDSIFSPLLCRSVSLPSSLLADADCLCNALKTSWVAIQKKIALCCVAVGPKLTGLGRQAEASALWGENNDRGC